MFDLITILLWILSLYYRYYSGGLGYNKVCWQTFIKIITFMNIQQLLQISKKIKYICSFFFSIFKRKQIILISNFLSIHIYPIFIWESGAEATFKIYNCKLCMENEDIVISQPLAQI